MNKINVSAGQTPLSPGCRRKLGLQMDAPIYYPEYFQTEILASKIIQSLVASCADILIITGNATHAIETVLVSLLEPGEEILVVNSGIFGQVFCEIAAIIGAKVIELKVPYGKAVTPHVLDKTLSENPEVKAVCLVHVETSTGAVAPLEKLSPIVRRHEKLLIVDVVSSIGALQIKMDDWGIDVLIGSGQKALNAPQGLALLGLNEYAKSVYESRIESVKTVCLDLGIWREYRKINVEKTSAAFAQNTSNSPTLSKIIHGPSPSGPLMNGLLGALQDLEKEGFEKVFHRHRIISKAVRFGIRELGLEILADETIAAPSVTTILLPECILEFDLRKHIYTKYGIALGAGPVEIGLNAFRIGTMGRSAHPNFQLPVLSALAKGMTDFGHQCDAENALDAANKVINSESDNSLWEIPK